MEQMRGKIKCSCLRSSATGWGFQSVSHVWPLCCFEALLQLIKTVFTGMPGVHLWVTQAMTATSMYSQAQGSQLNNSTWYDRTKSKIKSPWRHPRMSVASICFALVKDAASKHCGVNITLAALMLVLFHLWTDTSDINWQQRCCRSDQTLYKRKGALTMGCSNGY